MVKKIFLAIAVAFISAFPLLHKGLPPTHDGEYHVIRFYEFYKTLSDGNLYPRWAPDLNNGFGIPLFNYVYPLPNYVASFFHVFNFSFIDAFKLNMFLAVIVGSVFFYLWAKEFWGEWGALVSSALYSFSPYHLLDIYIRGSVGEVWALAFFPAFLWSITKFIKEDKFTYGIYSGIFLALIIFSHNILAFMFFFFSILYVAFIFLTQKKKISIYKLIVVFILGIGLSAIFWLPAILEKQYVRGLEVYDYSPNFPEFYQLLIPSWGSGFSGGSLQNELSFQIGIANLLAVFISSILLFKKKIDKRMIYFFLSSFIVVFILMLSISIPIWRVFPFMNYFQFPWRLLGLEILICSFLAGSVVCLWKGKILAGILIVITVLLGIGYTNPAYYHMRNDSYYISRSNFIDGTNSPGNAFNTIWMKNIKKDLRKVFFSKGEGDIAMESAKSTNYIFKVNAKENSELTVNSAYFPGWTVYVDKKNIDPNITDSGLLSFPIDRGNHTIQVKFENTQIRNVSELLSLISIIVLLLFKYPRFVRIKQWKLQ